MTGTCRNTAPAENSHATSPDTTAAAMLPARDHAALRPMRAVSTSRAKADRERRHCRFEHAAHDLHRAIRQQHRPEARCDRNDDGADRQREQAPQHGAALVPCTMSHAPIGTWAARPSQPPTVLTRPAVVGVQPVRQPEKPRHRAKPPRTSAIRKFSQSSDGACKFCGVTARACGRRVRAPPARQASRVECGDCVPRPVCDMRFSLAAHRAATSDDQRNLTIEDCGDGECVVQDQSRLIATAAAAFV